MEVGLEKEEAVQSKPKRHYKKEKERMKMFSLVERFMKESKSKTRISLVSRWLVTFWYVFGSGGCVSSSLSFLFFFFFLFSAAHAFRGQLLLFLSSNSSFLSFQYLWTVHKSTNFTLNYFFSIKTCHTVLFTYLKIILLQYF